MAKTKKIALLILIAVTFTALIIYLSINFTGFRISTICTLLTLNGLSRKTGLDFDLYKKLHNDNNPLFRNGYFRDKYVRFFSELKGLYYCQVYILIQAGLFMLYGITSVVVRSRWYLFEIIMIIIAWIPKPLTQAIQYNYDNVLKRHLKRRNQTEHKNYFILQKEKLNAEVVPICAKEFSELTDAFASYYLPKGYVFWEKYLLENGIEILFYFHDDNPSLKIIQILRCSNNQTQGLAETINKVTHSFLSEYNSSGKKCKDLYITPIVYADYTPSISEIVDHPIPQGKNKHQLLIVVCADIGAAYISKPQGAYGLEKYEDMRHELLKFLTFG